MHRRHSQIGVA